ncbi:PAS domain-containing protein [Nitrincola sp. A-D6]|uniref:PAS domain-containing protein n=1 Tax=Nitrincola sp. A-D6 TaxID=1545442 RepID=UPI000690CF06|nr:PAS domain-containing protein [Nitrincola sp. A-D6]
MSSWEDIFRAAVEQSFNAVLITDANFEQGGPHIIFANHAFCRMTGYSQAELLGQSPRMLQGEFTDQKVIAELRHCLKHNLYFHGSTVNYRKEGVPYYVEWSISPVRNHAGEVANYVSVQQNITEHMFAEQEHRLLSQTLNSAADPIVITDNMEHILFANAAFEQMTGYTSEQIIGKTPDSIRSSDQNENFNQQLSEALQQGAPFRCVFSNRRKEGDLIFTEQNNSAVKGDKETVTRRTSVGKDITDLLQREMLLQEIALMDRG